MNIIIQQATNINRHIAEAKRAAGVEDCAKAKEAVYAGRKKACELFYDVRTFGAVMSTGPNAGQVRGPVQITYGKSLDAVLPLDISITRMAVADKVKDGATVEDYAAWEQENMYEHDHSASKGEMAVVSPLIIFRHVGTDTDAAQRIRQAKLGCAPAHKLFDLVKVTKKASVSYPRSYRDYDALVSLDRVPKGVQIGFKPSAFEPVVWDALPADEDWFCHG